MPAVPFWFGGADRPLFGWAHLPDDGRARAGVVLCPPLGIEAICTYYTYRQLAERLAASGLVAVRFDYDGTGDSYGGQSDPDRVGSWLTSVRAAIEEARGIGVERLAVVGIRMGALLGASAVAELPAVDGFVLWDPCLSGSAFMREQKAFRMLSLGGETADDGSVEAPGMLFPPQVVADLGTLDLLKSNERIAAQVLVLEDPNKPHSSRLEKRLSGSRVTLMPASGQSALLDPPRQETAWASIESVTNWLGALFADSASTRVLAPTRQEAAVGTDGQGRNIVERLVFLGPQELFGIVTEHEEYCPGTTIIFIDEGNTPHIGQSRMWVELARVWACHQLRVVRFDLSGNGDSGTRPGQLGHVPRALEAFDDVEQAAAAISPDDPRNVVLVGLCSGAYQALEAGLTLRPRGVLLINPVLTFDTSEAIPDPGRRARQSTKRWFVRAASPLVRVIGRLNRNVDVDRWLNSLEVATWPAAMRRRAPGVPEAVWWAVKRVLLQNPSDRVLSAVANGGVEIHLVVGPSDFLPIAMGGRARLKKLQRRGGLRLDVIEGLDHAALIVAQRTLLMDVMSDHVVGQYAPEKNALPLFSSA